MKCSSLFVVRDGQGNAVGNLEKENFRDPTTGNTMELSNQFDHARLNGANEYIMSDDPNFNANGVLNGDWNQLQVVRPAP
jgi:hypothetical protein